MTISPPVPEYPVTEQVYGVSVDSVDSVNSYSKGLSSKASAAGFGRGKSRVRAKISGDFG
jgi:hypothetical protein